MEIQHLLRKTILPLLGRSAPPGDEPLPDLGSFDRVLLSFVNWRLGNNVLITPAVQALTDAYPHVQFDFVGGPSAVPVLKGFRLGTVHVVTRAQVIDPIRLWAYGRRLRKLAYPAAIHVHPGTATLGAYFTGLSRAPVRIGCIRSAGNLYFTSTVPRPTTAHKVDRMNEYLRHLGLPGGHVRQLMLDESELQEADAQLAGLGAPDADRRAPFFLGGRARKGKSWPLGTFAAVADGLRARSLQPIAILGPEELKQERRIREALGDAIVMKQLPIRRVASILAQSRLVLAPDSGPMHVAVATRTPTIGLFRTPTGHEWGPREGQGACLHDPTGEDVAQILAAVDAVLEDSSAGGGREA